MKRQRYEVMPCSASGAHDFHATVIDTHMTSYEKGICECFEKKDAEFIAAAMNRDNRIRELKDKYSKILAEMEKEKSEVKDGK